MMRCKSLWDPRKVWNRERKFVVLGYMKITFFHFIFSIPFSLSCHPNSSKGPFSCRKESGEIESERVKMESRGKLRLVWSPMESDKELESVESNGFCVIYIYPETHKLSLFISHFFLGLTNFTLLSLPNLPLLFIFTLLHSIPFPFPLHVFRPTKRSLG